MIEKHEDPAGDGNLNNVENDAYIELRNTKTPQGTETQRLLCTLCKTLAIEKHEDPAGDGNFYTDCHRAYRCSIEKHEDPAGDGNSLRHFLHRLAPKLIEKHEDPAGDGNLL